MTYPDEALVIEMVHDAHFKCEIVDFDVKDSAPWVCIRTVDHPMRRGIWVRAAAPIPLTSAAADLLADLLTGRLS
jgi:hypothetical protein